MSSLILRQFIRNLVVEALDTGGDSELSEVVREK